MEKKFNILHLDPMGQGVSKEGDEILFVAKTLSGESGIAKIDHQKKKISFGHLSSPEDLKVRSPDRIESECDHFNICSGCHFLHAPYEIEKTHKLENLKRLAKIAKMPIPDISFMSAPSRLGYRNRIQLHYQTKTKTLGLFSNHKKSIIPVPNCLIGNPAVKKTLAQLYAHNYWLTLVQSEPTEGHIEIYQKNNEENPRISINQSYSHGGFSQVNEQANHLLQLKVQELTKLNKPSRILDLFGGNGNLTSLVDAQEILVLDSFKHIPAKPNQTFAQVDLYNKNWPEKLKLATQKSKNWDLIILDPPRSGFKELKELCEIYSNSIPLIYVSCDPNTLMRDLQSLVNSYQINQMILLDLFPGTFHYETIVQLLPK